METHLIGKRIGSVEVSSYIAEADQEVVAPILFSNMQVRSVLDKDGVMLYTGVSQDFREIIESDGHIPVYRLTFIKHENGEIEFSGFVEQRSLNLN